MSYDALVAQHGLSEAHRLVLAAVPDRARVLDVGCAGGHLGAALLERGCAVVGIELAGAAARARGLDVLEGSIDDPAVRARIDGGFDAVLCADVLEHLPRPDETLAFLAGRLAPDGRVSVSLPNAGHWTMRRAILRGRFPQEDFGLFDRTHLRWFTRAGARALLEGAGLTVADERFTEAPLPLEAHIGMPAALRRAAVRRWPELFALQVVLTGRR